jgi:hypothetical protein
MSTLRDNYPDLPSLLAAIRQRPGMFLGHKTVFGLSLLLSGIMFAEDYHEIPGKARIGGFDLEKFEKWVESEYNPQRLSHNSLSLAEHLAGSDAAGFDLWFSWYDEYQRRASAPETKG